MPAATFSLETDEGCETRGLETLAADAWRESGRHGGMPPGWRPFDRDRSEGIALRERGTLAGYAVVRPAEGMDGLDFLYVKKPARRVASVRALIERATERLREKGLTRIVYAGFGWWRRDFPPAFARAFEEAEYKHFLGVFLARPLEAAGPPPAAVADGYEVRDFRDENFVETCAVMLASPEPEAIYWDEGLCRRSILAAGNPLQPIFPGGRGQVAWRDGRIVGFALATQHGYVNHVYTHPDHRGRGLGAAMITRLLAAIARTGIARATILTHETNPGAIALYERLGFVVDFRFPQFYIKW